MVMQKFQIKQKVPSLSIRYHLMLWPIFSCWESCSYSSFTSSMTLFLSIWSSFFYFRDFTLNYKSYFLAIFQRYSTLAWGIFFGTPVLAMRFMFWSLDLLFPWSIWSWIFLGLWPIVKYLLLLLHIQILARSRLRLPIVIYLKACLRVLLLLQQSCFFLPLHWLLLDPVQDTASALGGLRRSLTLSVWGVDLSRFSFRVRF